MTAQIDPVDIAFMRAVGWSEPMLSRIKDGWQPPYTTEELAYAHERAMHDALRSMASGFPDPAHYAAMLEPIFAEAIMNTTHGRTGGLWVDDGPLVPALRSLGLIGIRDRELTDFAMRVRRELTKAERGE